MNMRIFILSCLSVAISVGCDSKDPSWAKKSEQAQAYERIASGDEDPAENGPDDSKILNSILSEKGEVPFKHFSHSSNGEKGFGIACQKCHHGTPEGELPMEGCSTCHGAQNEKDPAHLGPDDNLVLGQLAKKAVVVPFNHFTHASVRGYKNDCDACHHKGGNVECQNCHREVAVVDGQGNEVPKVKRAYHKLCKERCHEGFREKQPDSRAPVSCVECHRDRSALALRRLPGALSLERAYHLSCISCHQQYKASNPSSIAPVKCKGCHTRPPVDSPGVVVEDKPLPSATDGDTLDTAPATEEEKAGDDEKGIAVILLRHEGNKMDPVPLTHHDHQELGEACSKCHHEGMDEPTCSSCHEGAKEAKKIFHKLCVACHKANGAKAGCKDCHKKAAV